MTPTQKLVLQRLQEGRRLMWFGDNGPEMEGYPFWPSKRTVRAMLKKGWLRWLSANNPIQADAGIFPIGITDDRREQN